MIDIWDQASLTLKDSDELIIIGYSLPRADATASLLLANSVKNSKISRIVLIDPDGLLSHKFRKIFKKDIYVIKERFENWVKSACKGL